MSKKIGLIKVELPESCGDACVCMHEWVNPYRSSRPEFHCFLHPQRPDVSKYLDCTDNIGRKGKRRPNCPIVELPEDGLELVMALFDKYLGGACIWEDFDLARQTRDALKGLLDA